MDVGATLREAREHRGLSLESMALRTRIPIDHLREIEFDDFDRLPARVFTRGFLGAYAREVGLDAAPLLAQYEAELAARAPAPTEAPHRARENAVPAISSPSTSTAWIRPEVGTHVSWALTVLLIGAFVLLLSPHSVFSPASSPPAQPRVDTPASSPAAPAGPVATAGSGFRVELDAQRSCWVSASADGERVIFKTLLPGEHKTIAVSSELSLRVGDGGALTVAIDGVAARPLGRPGQPITVRITRENYRELLVAEPPKADAVRIPNP